MALPFIGMFVGADELVPTKAIYAIYDPSNCGIAYIRGDGTFAVARQICFTRQFKDASSPLHRSQRTHLPELMTRSALHYGQINSKNYLPAEILTKFPTQSSVKASLTYVNDLIMNSCPALTNFDATPKGTDRTPPPHIDLEESLYGTSILLVFKRSQSQETILSTPSTSSSSVIILMFGSIRWTFSMQRFVLLDGQARPRELSL